MTTTQKMHAAEVAALANQFTEFSTPEVGCTYQAEAHLGSEGKDSWSRWNFEATPQLIEEAGNAFSNPEAYA